MGMYISQESLGFVLEMITTVVFMVLDLIGQLV